MNNTYCILPFIHLATERNGNYMPCCASKETTGHNLENDRIETVWSSDYYKKLRSDLLSGIQHPNCEVCWDYENLGIVSKRQISNANKDILTTALSVPIELDIKTGNLCNLKCITCNQLASSQHENEVENWKKDNIKLPMWLKNIDESTPILDLQKIDNVAGNLDASLKIAESMILQGGEPFVTPMTSKIIDYCIEKNYTQIAISIITNLSTVTPRVLDKIKKFPKAGVAISYDHVDPDKFKFIRYPAEFRHFEQNLKTITNNKSFKFGISFTISIFNALDLDQIFEKFIELSTFDNFRFINVQPVVEPIYFSVVTLENDQKIQTRASIEKLLSKKSRLTEELSFVNSLQEIVKILSIDLENFDDVVKERTRVLKLYDQTRNTDYKKLFPYIKDYE
jgi:MoaA/NifB/PqqE/SkfB family radical SAM enzyme